MKFMMELTEAKQLNINISQAFSDEWKNKTKENILYIISLVILGSLTEHPLLEIMKIAATIETRSLTSSFITITTSRNKE